MLLNGCSKLRVMTSGHIILSFFQCLAKCVVHWEFFLMALIVFRSPYESFMRAPHVFQMDDLM